MSRFTIQLLTAVVLLGAGLATGTYDSDDVSRVRTAVDAPAAAAQLTGGDMQPTPAFLAGVGADVDVRTGRNHEIRQSPLHSRPAIRRRPRCGGKHPTAAHHACDVTARLQRGGLASSSLGTPPPNA